MNYSPVVNEGKDYYNQFQNGRVVNITKTNYKKFITLSSVKQFTYMAKKYDEIINSSKGELSSISINKFINFQYIHNLLQMNQFHN